MKKAIFALAVLVLAGVPAVWAAHAVDGSWEADVPARDGTRPTTFTLKADGDKLTGTISDERGDSEIQDGKISGDEISFTQERSFGGNTITFNYTGKVSGDEIQFTREIPEFDRTSEFTAKRKK